MLINKLLETPESQANLMPILSGQAPKKIPEFEIAGKWTRYLDGMFIANGSTPISDNPNDVAFIRWVDREPEPEPEPHPHGPHVPVEMWTDLQALHDELAAMMNGQPELLTPADLAQQEQAFFQTPQMPELPGMPTLDFGAIINDIQNRQK